MSKPSVTDIYNFLALSDALGTAGQPLAAQFSAIKNAGYQVVINLALATSPQALLDEKEIVERQGMEYIHIPVVWESPRVEDALHFFDAMKAHADTVALAKLREETRAICARAPCARAISLSFSVVCQSKIGRAHV